MIASPVMVPAAPSSAEGDFEQTPFAHLAVYALDRKLTGELFLIESDEVAHAIAFRAGVPTKIKMGNGLFRLGDLLVLAGLVERDKVEGAALTGGLLGDVLVLAGCVETDGLNRVLDEQFQKRFDYFFSLPKTTTYKYFDQSSTLEDWGADPTSLDPLALIWRGLRAHADNSSHFESTLERLGDAPLALHAKAPLHRLELEEDVKTAAEVLSIEPTPLSEISAIDGQDPQLVRRLIYCLTILRQLDLGRGGLPVGVEERIQSLAKVQLRSQALRVGVALDHPGDGERTVRPITVRGRAVIPRDDNSEPPPPDSNVEAAPSSAPSAVSEGEAVAEKSIAESAAEIADAGSSAPEAPILETTMAELSEEELAGDSDAPPVPSDAAEPAAAEPAAVVPPSAEDDEGEASSRRLVNEAIRSLPSEALLKLANEKLTEKEPGMAAAVAELAIARLSEAGDTKSDLYCELVARHAQAKSLEPHPDLKSLALALDEVVRTRDDMALVRFVRGQVRKRLGNESGYASDMRRVLELDPNHEEAKKATSQDATKTVKAGQTGFLKRLFGR